jgi:hypothetical protein
MTNQNNNITCISILYDFFTCQSLQNWSCDEASGCYNNKGQTTYNLYICCEIECLACLQKTLCYTCIKK